MFGFFADHLSDARSVLGGRGAVGQGLRVARDGRHRRLEVVRDVSEQHPHLRITLANATGHRRERTREPAHFVIAVDFDVLVELASRHRLRRLIELSQRLRYLARDYYRGERRQRDGDERREPETRQYAEPRARDGVRVHGEHDARIDALVAAAHAVRIEDVMVRPTVLDRLKTAIVAMLGEHHRDQPLSEGMPRGEARERLFGRGHPLVFERAVAELAAAGRIAARDRLALVSHRVSLSPEEERARAALERAFRDGGLRPPDAGSLVPAIGVAPAVADRMVKLLQRQKVLVKVDELLFHEEALRELKRAVTALKVSGGPNARIDVGTFKERFGITRKFAIPLLGYLDRERVTRRVGDARVVL